jgi:hypothetical protein
MQVDSKPREKSAANEKTMPHVVGASTSWAKKTARKATRKHKRMSLSEASQRAGRRASGEVEQSN